MSPQHTARLRAELAAARQGLQAVATTTDVGSETFDSSLPHQRALALCCIATGGARSKTTPP